MMERRALLRGLVLALVSAPLAAEAQQARQVCRIGYLSFEPTPTPDVPAIGLASFRQGLRDLGYVEGQNLVVEYRWAGLDIEQVSQLVTKLVDLHVDVIVTWATGVVLRVKRVTSTVPIVCAVCADLVGGGAVASLARPGGNVTGFTVIGPDLAAKRIESLKEMGVSRVVGLHASAATFPVAVHWRTENERAAQALGVRVETRRAHTVEALEQSVAAAATERGSALSFMEEPFYLLERRRIAALALRHRVPTVFPFREHVEAGGLLSYGTNLPELFRRAATFVDKILKGAKPADLPVEQPTKFELVINMRTAKALGLTIPPSILVRADQIIE
jgi:putative tryptophan/tyrosine transport system substrate-binding protein